MTISYAAARQAPLLEYEQERSLISLWQESGNKQALETLVISHARLVFACARKLSNEKSDQEELISEGLLGLVKAAEAFDLDRNVRFSTYARWWVKNSVTLAFSKLNSVVSVPVQSRHPNDTTSTRLLSYSGVDGLDDGDVENYCSQDPTPEENLIARSARDRMRGCIVEAMNDLCQMEREILFSRNLQLQPISVEELSSRMGISRERLRQIERRALSKLKYELLSRGFTSI